MFWFRSSILLALVLLGACSHAPPRLVQVFSQVNQVYRPDAKAWSEQLAVFVQAASADGTKVFDRLHLIHDGQNLYFTLDRNQWAKVERPGEFWVGANDLAFPQGVPTGTWRVLLVTSAGQRLSSTFEVPPQSPGAVPRRSDPIRVKAATPPTGRFQVTGWVDDYLVWSRDANGTVVSQTKNVGSSFPVAPGAQSFLLYSYDKNRGQGLVAGPFPVQERP